MLALPLLVTLSLAAAGDAQGAAVGTWKATEGSTVSYHLVHKFHAVDGVAHAVEGRARLGADGSLQVAVRAKVAAFDSGNSNRDAHMMEVTDAAAFPFVTVKGTAEGVRASTFPSVVEVPLRATLELHGVTTPLEVKARVRFTSPQRAEIEADFPVSLTAHKVERPSLLFVKVDDRIEIAARLVFVAE